MPLYDVDKHGGEVTKTREVTEISVAQRDAIIAYLRDAVDAWCKVNGNKSFFAADLIQGDLISWNVAPLAELQDAFAAKKGAKDPPAEASQALGNLLKTTLVQDSRDFETKKELRKGYPSTKYRARQLIP